MADTEAKAFHANASGIPAEIKDYPLGTLDEIEALGLDPEQVRTCAKPNRAAGVLGCAQHHNCPMSYRGKTVAEGGGARRHAWDLIRSQQMGGGMVRIEGECFRLVERLPDIEANGGAVRIIANEGESYKFKTGIAVKTFVDAEGKSQSVVAKRGEEHLPNVKRRDMVIDMVVVPFVRPKDNPALAGNRFEADAIREETERRRDEAPGRALGLSRGGTPLDLRDRASGEGPPEGKKGGPGPK